MAYRHMTKVAMVNCCTASEAGKMQPALFVQHSFSQSMKQIGTDTSSAGNAACTSSWLKEHTTMA